uniref:Alpha-1,3-glucosyltransferase n=1 Tax=Alexandrium monilatum TaxID=311494 RepID=A0A7S4SUW3_9DINO
MARAVRSTKLSVLLLGVASCLAAHWLLTPLRPMFIQPREKVPTASEVSALGAAVALTASLPAEAFKGPLAGSEVCKSKPLVWFIYPLCDPVFLAAPPYFFPLLFIFYGVIVTTIQLLIPATQPDEDLR